MSLMPEDKCFRKLRERYEEPAPTANKTVAVERAMNKNDMPGELGSVYYVWQLAGKPCVPKLLFESGDFAIICEIIQKMGWSWENVTDFLPTKR